MTLRIYNTLTRAIEEFVPQGDVVKLYTCGPTVYNFAHIGNFRAYVSQDVFKRYLLYKGFRVKHVMNLTDVDDKTIRDSQKEGVPLAEFTDRYKKAFFEDAAALNIAPADAYPAATQYIEGMISLIETLLAKGVAYKGEDGSVYYNVRKFPGYGKLSHFDLSGLQAGARVKQDEYSKEQANDFALWKAWDPSDGDVFWESPWGRGRPGWHIECSVMSASNLGETLDVHAGGVDLIFPHHEDEIAQSEAATGKPFARYWMHNEYLLVEGKKMSKSLGNFYTLRDVLAKGYDGKAVRWLLLGTHYRQQLNFSFAALDGAAAAVAKLEEFALNLRDAGKGQESDGMTGRLVDSARRGFEEAMDADLNVPEALAAVFDFVREANKLLPRMSAEDAGKALYFIKDVNRVLGVLDDALREDGEKLLPPEIDELVGRREAARTRKKWQEADGLRTQIEALGWQVQDQKDGPPKVRRKNPSA